ncbi:CoA transferase [Variovorax paradoxus]|uniref:CoA transferase n=1 Tax=Variovorax paradoxus TaxID=34073 RepID=UPI002860699D|nr:CoA transferase [Variovorax paradoxus]MDR6455596.1 2-methylfumaryl-CoA isomerase [Variovorax paradoxus]
MTYPFLNRLRVIESSAFIAAPLAGLTLAQHGADVIRVDMIGGGIDYGRMPRMPHPEGRGRSLYWTALNKGKRSIAIDLRKSQGRELIQALATAPGPEAGVLLTNIGTPWLAHGVLAARRADVISCTIQGNGDGSTAVDYTVNCATGYPLVTGGGSMARPVNHVLPAWDIACAYQAAFAVVAAVDRRRRMGEGAELKLALSDTAFTMLSHLGVLAEAELLRQERPSIGNHLYGAFGRDFGTADGQRLMVVAISAGQWKCLVNACGIAEGVKAIEQRTGLDLSDEAQRFEARDAIAELVEPWFAARTREQAERELDAHKATWGGYGTVGELLASDSRVSVATNPVFERIDTPGIGQHIAAGAAVRAPGLAREPTAPAALLGTHTDEVLHEVLGLDGVAIGRLHDAGVVAGPECDPTSGSSGAA